jgi:hypothetical protein
MQANMKNIVGSYAVEVITLLLGLQDGFNEYYCFPC